MGLSPENEAAVQAAAQRLGAAFDWIDIGSWDKPDLRVIASVALGLELDVNDVARCMGLGWGKSESDG